MSTMFSPESCINPHGINNSFVSDPTLGARVELTCSAYVGFSKDDLIDMHWTIDSAFCETLKECNQSWE